MNTTIKHSPDHTGLADVIYPTKLLLTPTIDSRNRLHLSKDLNETPRLLLDMIELDITVEITVVTMRGEVIHQEEDALDDLGFISATLKQLTDISEGDQLKVRTRLHVDDDVTTLYSHESTIVYPQRNK